MRTLILVCYVVILGSGDAFGLGSMYPNDKPVMRGASWPEGMTELVNNTNRVYGFWVNGTDVFSFSGQATNLSAFLAEYSRISGVDKHRLILHEGVGRARSAFENSGTTFDWKVIGCAKGWHNLTKLSGSTVTNSFEELQKMFEEPGYVLEVHFWTGARIALDQVVVPKNIEVRKAE